MFRIAIACFLIWIGHSASAAQPLQELIGTSGEVFMGDLPEIRERRLIRVLVTHSQTDFFLDQGRLRGVQAELVQAFLDHLNEGTRRESKRLVAQFIPVQFNDLIPALAEGRGDLAAAFLTITPQRSELVDFVGGYSMQVSEVVVTHRDRQSPQNLADLSGESVYVLRDSSYAEHLRALNSNFARLNLPPVTVTESDNRLLSEDILELVNAGVVDLTVIDDFKARLWARVLPDIRVHDLAIASNRQVGWAIRKQSPVLATELADFASQVKRGTLLGNILFKRYFRNTQWIDNPTAEAQRDKLTRHLALFQKYAGMYDFDPLALAAQAYQESRLDHSKKSPRGAVGIMQLLPTTARDPNVDIPDISELEDNIHAGARYLDFLRKRYFSDPAIDPWDQRLFSWAAYNAGPAAVIRIRKAAARQGLDPNVWFGNVEVMAGRMISREPVRYVANINKYYTAYRLIEQQSRQRNRAMRDPT